MQYDEPDEKLQMGQDINKPCVSRRYLPPIAPMQAFFANTEHPSSFPDDVAPGLANSEWRTWVVAAQALAQQGDHSAVAELTAMVENPSIVVRIAAIEGLAALGSQVVASTSVIPVALKALNDSAWEVREAAAFALGQMGSHMPAAPLIEALNDDDALVRATVIRALGNAGVRCPLPVIVAALNDESGVVREAAVTVLSQLGRRAPVLDLMSALYDEVECVQLGARRGLVNLEATPLAKSVFAAYEITEGTARLVATEAFRVCTDLALIILDEQVPIETVRMIFGEVQGQDYRAVQSYLLARALNELNESTPHRSLLESLLSELHSDTEGERINAWSTIMWFAQVMLRQRSQVGVLVAASREEEQMVRNEAEWAIVELVDLALKVLDGQMETTHPIREALQGEDRPAAENAMWLLVGRALKVLEELSSKELETLLAAFKHHESLKRAAAGHRLAQRAHNAIAEYRSTSASAVFSLKNSSQTTPTKWQLGSPLWGQDKKTYPVLPWRETLVPLDEEKPHIAVLGREQRQHFAARWN